MMTNADFVYDVLVTTQNLDCMDSLMWDCAPDGTVSFYIECNDLFYWACAESEPLTPDNIDALRQAYNDTLNGSLLFCARMRHLRPQGVMYRYIDVKDHAAFDACGPVRMVDVDNPYNHPADGGLHQGPGPTLTDEEIPNEVLFD